MRGALIVYCTVQAYAMTQRDPGPPLAGRSILIIEDEPLVALDLHAALSRKGASVISATSAAEAAKLIGYADISAAIVDINLGTQDAAEASAGKARHSFCLPYGTAARCIARNVV